VVVKSYPPTSEGAEGFIGESAGLEFSAELAQAPDLLAANAENLLVVMSDLGTGQSLADMLLVKSAWAARAVLIDWAHSCAGIAVHTAGRRAEFEGLEVKYRNAVSAAHPELILRPSRRWLERGIATIPARLKELSIEAPLPLDDDLDAVAALLPPGSADVFSPGDICPDNNLITPAGIRFIDFESAGFHSALLDAAYLHMPFSTCWCVFRLPAELAREAEARYRAIIVGAFPEFASDEIWRRGVRLATAAWTLHALTYLLDRSLIADESMNPDVAQAPTRRQLLTYRWRRLADELDAAGELPAIAALARQMLARTKFWRAPELPLYPAFR